MSVRIEYFASLKDKTGKAYEEMAEAPESLRDLYAELNQKYDFDLCRSHVKVAVNNHFCDWESKLNSGDTVVFIPPVAGG